MSDNSLLNPVYTIQPVVKPVEQRVGQPVECLFTRCSQLFNRFDNRLYRADGVLDTAVRRHLYVPILARQCYSRVDYVTGTTAVLLLGSALDLSWKQRLKRHSDQVSRVGLLHIHYLSGACESCSTSIYVKHQTLHDSGGPRGFVNWVPTNAPRALHECRIRTDKDPKK